MELFMTNNTNYISLDFIQVNQPIGCFYVTSMKFRDILAIAKADVRKLNSSFDDYLGIQRKISSERKKEIALYASTIDATFPTSIILAIKSQDDNSNDENGEPIKNIFIDENNNKLKIRMQDGVASILDGQHRLEGLRQADEDLENIEFDLNVTIFVDADIETQTQIFSVINKSQTKVNKSLVYDLYEYATHRSPFKTAHDVVRVLNRNEKSPFFQKIKLLGTANDKERESIAQATFAELILSYISQNPIDDRDRLMRGKKIECNDDKKLLFRKSFINGKDSDITRILYCYFDAVRNKWKKSWEQVVDGNILNKSTGIIALMKFLKDICERAQADEQLLTKDFYSNILQKLDIEDGTFDVDKYKPGTKGQSALYDDLKAALNKTK